MRRGCGTGRDALEAAAELEKRLIAAERRNIRIHDPTRAPGSADELDRPIDALVRLAVWAIG